MSQPDRISGGWCDAPLLDSFGQVNHFSTSLIQSQSPTMDTFSQSFGQLLVLLAHEVWKILAILRKVLSWLVVSMVSPPQFWVSSFPNIESSDQMITGKECWRMWPPLQECAIPVPFFGSIQCFSFSSEKPAGLTSHSNTTQKTPEPGSKGQPERRCHGGLWQGPAGMQLIYL